MSKELINEIESKIAWNDKSIDETSISLSDVKRLLNELEKQAERIQELELEVNDWRDEAIKWNKRFEESEESHSETLDLLHSTASITKRYREALEFYANEETYETKFATDTDEIYDPFTLIELDEGRKARKALESEE